MTFTKRTDWVDTPSTATPVMAADLLRIEQGIADAQNPTLATVATTGSYTDLTNQPVIPAAYTDENARDAIGAALVAGANVTITVNDAADTITVAASSSGSPADATTTSKGVVQLAGDLSGTAVAPTVPGLANKLTAKNNTTTLSPALTDYWQKVEVIDDGTTTTSWPNRLEVAFTPSGGTRGLTTYLNEYGELRVEPAKSNTVAARFFTKHQPGDAAHTVNVFEMMDDRTTRTVLMSIDASGNVHAPNLPNKITVASTAPSSPAVNDLWVDLSA